jgi:hypothetical protein
MLSPSYCYPEDALGAHYPADRQHYLGRWGRDYEPRIVALRKSPPPPSAAPEAEHPPAAAPASRLSEPHRTGLRLLARGLKMRWRGQCGIS